MKLREKGFTIIELVVAMSIMTVISGAAVATMFRTTRTTESSNNHMTAVQQVQSAGYWITRDAHMAESITVDNVTPGAWLVLTWLEWNYDGGSNITHWVIYSIENIVGGVGNIKRNYWNSAGAATQTLVAKYIYFNPSDPTGTTQGTYEYPEFDFRLAARFDDTSELRDYKVTIRPNLY